MDTHLTYLSSSFWTHIIDIWLLSNSNPLKDRRSTNTFYKLCMHGKSAHLNIKIENELVCSHIYRIEIILIFHPLIEFCTTNVMNISSWVLVIKFKFKSFVQNAIIIEWFKVHTLVPSPYANLKLFRFFTIQNMTRLL